VLAGGGAVAAGSGRRLFRHASSPPVPRMAQAQRRMMWASPLTLRAHDWSVPGPNTSKSLLCPLHSVATLLGLLSQLVPVFSGGKLFINQVCCSVRCACGASRPVRRWWTPPSSLSSTPSWPPQAPVGQHECASDALHTQHCPV